jgi:DNA-binding Lrp family transcriptional regulator
MQDTQPRVPTDLPAVIAGPVPTIVVAGLVPTTSIHLARHWRQPGLCAIFFREIIFRVMTINASDPPEVRSLPARLDAIDRKILKELQDDGRITNVELASRVGISAPPCLRRVRALEEAGYIKGYRALLDEKKLGYEVTVFAMVHLSSQAEADLIAFEDFVRAQPLVRECWMLSGEIDFVLKCVAPDLKTFQAFVEKLTAAPNVRNVKTSLTLRNSKDAAMVPMDGAN